MTRNRSSPLGVALAVSKMLVFMLLPLLIEAAPWQDIAEIQQFTEGCYYNYNHYNEGDRILTNEPCLNCTCHNKMLMCYLRVCPFTKPIGHDCVVEKREDQCCPIITCPEVPVDIEHHLPEPGTELSIPEKYGCSIDQKFYPEGAQVPSNPNKPCELCYCIKNRTSCLMQECTLHIEGCMPIYNKGSCCPVRYNCDHENDVMELEDHSTSSTTTVRPTPGFVLTTTMSPSVSTDCIHDGVVYADGASLRGKNPCEHCYCMRGDIVCAVQECEMPMLSGNGKSCHPVPTNGSKCCPSHYICEDESTTTQIIDATSMSYVDGDVKLPTDFPLKDMHSFVSNEDLQLQKHIDDDEKLSTEEPKEVSEGEPIEDDSNNHVTESTHEIQLDTTLSITAATLVEDKQQSIALDGVVTEMNKIIDYATNKVLPSEIEDVVGTSATKSDVLQTPSEYEEDVHSVDATTLKIPATIETSTKQSEEEKIADGPIATTPFDFNTFSSTRSEETEDIEEITVSSFNKFKSQESNSDSDNVDVTTYRVVETDEASDFTTQSKISELSEAIDELLTEKIDSSQKEKPVSSTISEVTDQIELTTSKNIQMEQDLSIVNAEHKTTSYPATPQEEEEIPHVTTIKAFEDKYMRNITDSITQKPFLDKSVDHGQEGGSLPEKDVISEAINFTSSLNEEDKTESTILETSESITTTSASVELGVQLKQKNPLDETEQEKHSEDDEQFKHTPIFTSTEVTFTDGGEVQTMLPTIKSHESDDESDDENKLSHVNVPLSNNDKVSSDIDNGFTSKHIEENSFTEIPFTGNSLSEDIDTTSSPTTIKSLTEENLDMDFPYQHITDINKKKSNFARVPFTKIDEKTNELVTSTEASIHFTTESGSVIESVKTTTISEVNVSGMKDVTKPDLHEDDTTENIFNLEKIPTIIPGEGDCLEGEKTYQNNSVVPSFDECKISCRCISSIVICQHVKCQTPEDIANCVLSQFSTNKCCPTYICGTESKQIDFHENVKESEENKYISKPIEVVIAQSSTEELRETVTASTPVAIVINEINESPTYQITDIYAPTVSTEESFSHVKDITEEANTFSNIDDTGLMTEDSTSSDMKKIYVSSTILTTEDVPSFHSKNSSFINKHTENSVTENSDQASTYVSTDKTQTELPAISVSNKTNPDLMLQIVDSGTEESETKKLNKSEQNTTTSISPSDIMISTEYGYTERQVENEDLVHITPTIPSTVMAEESIVDDISAHSIILEQISTTEIPVLSQDTNKGGSGSTIAGDAFLDYTSTSSVGNEDVVHFTPTTPSLTTDEEIITDDTIAHSINNVSKVNDNESMYTFVPTVILPEGVTERKIEDNTTPPASDTTSGPSIDSNQERNTESTEQKNTIINEHTNYPGDLEHDNASLIGNNNTDELPKELIKESTLNPAIEITTEKIAMEHFYNSLSNEDEHANSSQAQGHLVTLDDNLSQIIEPNSKDEKKINTPAMEHNITSVDGDNEVTTEIYSANTIASLNDVKNGNVPITAPVDGSEEENYNGSLMHTISTEEQKETHSTTTEYMSAEITDDYRGYTLAPVEHVAKESTQDTSSNTIISFDDHSTVTPTVNIEKEALDDNLLNTIAPSVFIAANESITSKEQHTMTSTIEGVTESIHNALIHSEVLAPTTVDSVSISAVPSEESEKEINADIITDVDFQSTNLTTMHNISPDISTEKETITMTHNVPEILYNKTEHVDAITSYTTNPVDEGTTISTDKTTTLSTKEVQGESATEPSANIIYPTTKKETLDHSLTKAIISSTDVKVEESFPDPIISTTEFNTEVTTSATNGEKKPISDTEAHTIAPLNDIYTTTPIDYSITDNPEFTVKIKEIGDDNLIHMLITSIDNKTEAIITDSMEQSSTPSVDLEEKTVRVTSRYDTLFTEVQTEKSTDDSLTISTVAEDEKEIIDSNLAQNITPLTTDDNTQKLITESDLKVTSSPYSTTISTEEKTYGDGSTTYTSVSVLDVKDSIALTIAPTTEVQEEDIDVGGTSTTTPFSNSKMEDSGKDSNHIVASSYNEEEYSNTPAVEDYEKLYTISSSADDKTKLYTTSDAIENPSSTETISDRYKDKHFTISDIDADDETKTIFENFSQTISPHSDNKMDLDFMMHTSSPTLMTEKAQIDKFAQTSTSVSELNNASNEVPTDVPLVSNNTEYIDETLSNTINTLIEEKGNIELTGSFVKNSFDEFLTHTIASISKNEAVSKDNQHLIVDETTEAAKDSFNELNPTESTQINKKDEIFEHRTSSIYEKEKQVSEPTLVSEINTRNETMTIDDIELALVTEKSKDIIDDQTSTKSTQIYEYEQPTSDPILSHTDTPSIVQDNLSTTLSFVSTESGKVSLTVDDSKLQTVTPIKEETVTEMPTVVTEMQLIDETAKKSAQPEEEITTDSNNHNIQQVAEFVTERVEDTFTEENIFDKIEENYQVSIGHQVPINSSIEPMQQLKPDLLETVEEQGNEHHSTVTSQKTQVTIASIPNSLGSSSSLESEIKSTTLEQNPTESNEISDISTPTDKSRKTTVQPHNLEGVTHEENVAKKTESLGDSDKEKHNDSSYTQEEIDIPLSSTVPQLLSYNTDHTTSEPIIGQAENDTTAKNNDESSTATVIASVSESHSTTSTTQYPQQPGIYGQAPQYPSYPEDDYTDEDETEVFGPGTCRYGGKLFVSAQQIPRDDPCDFCFCFRSDIICLQQSCPPPISGCHEEPISGFCCPRYECPVSMATVLNITTSTTTTSTTLPPHFLQHAYEGAAERNGCHINGKSYRVGQSIDSTSGPCMHCTCGGDGQMKCDPKTCSPEPMLRQMIAVVASRRR